MIFALGMKQTGVIKMGRSKTDVLREQLFNDLQLTAKCINEFVDCNIPAEEQMRIHSLVVGMSELFMYWHKKGHCGEAEK